MSEKATFVESSRVKVINIFSAYDSKSRLSRWGYGLTTCQAIIYTNKTESIVKNNSELIF